MPRFCRFSHIQVENPEGERLMNLLPSLSTSSHFSATSNEDGDWQSLLWRECSTGLTTMGGGELVGPLRYKEERFCLFNLLAGSQVCGGTIR